MEVHRKHFKPGEEVARFPATVLDWGMQKTTTGGLKLVIGLQDRDKYLGMPVTDLVGMMIDVSVRRPSKNQLDEIRLAALEDADEADETADETEDE